MRTTTRIAAEDDAADRDLDEITGMQYPSRLKMKYSCTDRVSGDTAVARTSLANGRFVLELEAEAPSLPRKLRIVTSPPNPLPRSPDQISKHQFSYFVRGNGLANGADFDVHFIELVTIGRDGKSNTALSFSARIHVESTQDGAAGSERILHCRTS